MRVNPENIDPMRISAYVEAICGALILLVILCTPIPAKADDYRPELTIIAPTEYVSGAPLPLSELTEYRLYCDGETVPLATVAPTGASTPWQAEWGTFAPGDHSCTATAVNYEGSESAPSSPRTFTVARDQPGAPVLNIVAGGGA
ncbi:MAG: hypothetical protein K5880_22980 [Hydrogenophaga sp.]|uniref:hypothetical protein n=1 Tax=Hydrogenophaga sp. TaxID=1904254 RepID=UPI0026045E40|nr:hypothetical protein [Hydrogenophaga sp.]MCV0441462.1 hypothetical protein [Hydrogenophaga sp.]